MECPDADLRSSTVKCENYLGIADYLALKENIHYARTVANFRGTSGSFPICEIFHDFDARVFELLEHAGFI